MSLGRFFLCIWHTPNRGGPGNEFKASQTLNGPKTSDFFDQIGTLSGEYELKRARCLVPKVR